jgi:predicted phage tail protein
MKRF